MSIKSRVKKAIVVALATMVLATNISLTAPVATITTEAKAPETGHTKKVTMQRKYYVEKYSSGGYGRCNIYSNKIEKKLQAIIKECNITTNTTEYDAVKAFNTWICANIAYDGDGYSGKREKYHTTLEALTYGKVVCAGYADLFRTLCDYVGIDCWKVRSETHEWNIVSVDGVKYHIDTCWNWCYRNAGADKEAWFLLSESEITSEKEHHTIISSELNNVDGCYGYRPRYRINFYNINYKLNGGTNNKLNPTSYAVVENKVYSTDLNKLSKIKEPTRKGYTFNGWYSNGKKVTTFNQIKGTNPTLTAKWQKVSKPTLKNVKRKVDRTSYMYMNEVKLSWKKTADTKYEVKYTIKNNNRLVDKQTIKTSKNRVSFKLGKEDTYKVTIRAYRTDSTGKKVYSKTTKTFTGK